MSISDLRPGESYKQRAARRDREADEMLANMSDAQINSNIAKARAALNTEDAFETIENNWRDMGIGHPTEYRSKSMQNALAAATMVQRRQWGQCLQILETEKKRRASAA